MPEYLNPGITSQNQTDEHGNPSGGTVKGVGLQVLSQNGAVGPAPGTRNGAFVEDLIDATVQRLEFYQEHEQWRCRENALAITKLEEANHWLIARRQDRLDRGVYGTYDK